MTPTEHSRAFERQTVLPNAQPVPATACGFVDSILIAAHGGVELTASHTVPGGHTRPSGCTLEDSGCSGLFRWGHLMSMNLPVCHIDKDAKQQHCALEVSHNHQPPDGTPGRAVPGALQGSGGVSAEWSEHVQTPPCSVSAVCQVAGTAGLEFVAGVSGRKGTPQHPSPTCENSIKST